MDTHAHPRDILSAQGRRCRHHSFVADSCGEHEKIYAAQKAMLRLKKVAPQITAEVIPGAGHDFTIVQAEMLNRKVLDFLAQ